MKLRNLTIVACSVGLALLMSAPQAASAQIVVDGRIVETKAESACALLVSPASQKYIDCGNGTVYDTELAIFWLKDASCGLPGTAASWATAMDVVLSVRDGLDCDGNGSVDLTDGSQPEDWRLPTRQELSLLIFNPSATFGCTPALFNDSGTGCYATGPTSFVDLVEAGSYWSSTADETNPSQAWNLDLSTGSVTSVVKSSQLSFWPVRDALPWEMPFAVQVESTPVETRADRCLDYNEDFLDQRYVDCNNGTVLDTVTDLLWLQDATCAGLPFLAGGLGDWLDAVVSIARLADGVCGLTDGSQPGDWRLPSPLEWIKTSERAVALGCTTPGAKDPPALTDTAGTGCLDDGTTPFSGVLDALPDLRFWSNVSAFSPVVSLDFTRARAFNLNLGTSFTLLDKDFAGAYAWPVRPRKEGI